ncbi:hypothetical protein [Mesorhizobium opportunistum]|uniref:Uncharacterized protein n=1 Tax=Mesorhizobium opportunistum (strain LMG 24607 / HAMBI 3007 / WSM2075) TaxID=536019 RepID=F7YCJ8_MESOW|nr:hypothetical protein [Mesorhizobium opportunistum]AEH87810.1 hypothetical protein Mesop_3362 [Mesorhizobium opportunistum WSM2075]
MLSDAEVVYRSALYPRMVTSGVVAPERAVADFTSEDDADGTRIYTISVGRGNLLPTWAQAHDYGCRTAVEANAERERVKKAPLARPEETVHYIGSFKLDVLSVLNAPQKYLDLTVVHQPVPNLDEHCNIVMRRNALEARRIEVSAERTSIIAHLRLSLYEPEGHICQCDADLADSFGDVRLVLTPRMDVG